MGFNKDTIIQDHSEHMRKFYRCHQYLFSLLFFPTPFTFVPITPFTLCYHHHHLMLALLLPLKSFRSENIFRD